MLQHHWNKPDLEARFPVNSVVRYSGGGLKRILGMSGVVTGHSHTGLVKVRFGTQYAEVLPNNLIPLPKA
ncbi:gp 1.7, partial [Enterobacteria phage T7M]